ncbi:uncharacterized protein [Physcomitrium patens]|uniref:Methyltransferase type 11 domain-containing protein n=1 Tax=Physcomitrium patens TaxID=3218 RepID=A0A2K1JMX1_PHYPA|nr:uncharacterized protein LOC112290866 [Physcomitrium patens]PNR42746.1 hypothetical protein PHYPA_017576 [Physcomitrium patens]|eukprot:XP_024393432.1 uncharacterized protein LOC112290866 [Physcomitrella patens]
MIRDGLNPSVMKEFQRSLSIETHRLLVRETPKHSPRHGLMPSRNPRKAAFNWAFVFLAVLLTLLAGTLFFLSSIPSEQLIAPSGSQTPDDTVVHLEFLLLKLSALQEKALKASIDAQNAGKKRFSLSLPTAVADLKLERSRTHSMLSDLIIGLDGIAKSLKELKRRQSSEMNPTEFNVNNLLANVAGGDKGIVSMEDTKLVNRVKTPSVKGSNSAPSEPLYDFFAQDELRKYLSVRENRRGAKNFMGVSATYGTIGHACVSSKGLLEKYMDYDIGEVCRDDWVIAQQLILRGCEPLPRRRCRAQGPKVYKPPPPANESLWAIPANENIRWDNYFCKNFSCLADYVHRKKFFKCSPCFDLEILEKQRWVVPNTTDGEFLITDVLALKPGEVRIGLDYSMGTGTFAARMKEHDVTIVSTTLNLGAPFSETIALRGLVPLYISINQRLPFFDNTLDIVHTTMFLDAWVDHQVLDFILFDFDRVLRRGGLLWLDRFFCHREELAEYMFYFKRLRYKAHMWVTVPKTDKGKDEVYFSAVWEKPHTPF